MQLYAQFVSLMLSVFFTSATPLGDRRLLARYNGAPDTGFRDFISRSQITAPPACSISATAGTLPTSNTTNVPRISLSKRTPTPAITPSGWSDLCAASGISDLSVQYLCLNMGQDGWGFALSAAADACVQQTIADQMISFAKLPGILNSEDIISYAISYRQLARQAVSVSGVVPSTLYCTVPPVNPEISGIANTQPAGVNPGLFGSPTVPVVPFGSDGTCPYGSVPDVSTCDCTGSPVDIPTTASNTTTSLPANSTATEGACDTCLIGNSTIAGPDVGVSNITLTGDTVNSTVTGSDSALNGTDTSNPTLTGSNSTSSGVDTNSTLTSGSNSTSNGTDSITSTDTSGSNSTSNGTDSITSTDTSGSSATVTANSSLNSSAVSTSTDAGIIATSADIASTSIAPTTSPVSTSVESIEASTTSTASAVASTSTSGQTFDGNIHDPAGR
ncbi:hypothetical protein F5878DRAFT_98596 [Lentinula raphanica]|uniref:Uncharacterized protein n=1 Tax=Lentinula raphanica TaxID=153919 RepID=A0AA38PBG3_9AGAR|nr:hypothetical protein F5878DRAFT_98596 [Lentinula raphanica]